MAAAKKAAAKPPARKRVAEAPEEQTRRMRVRVGEDAPSRNYFANIEKEGIQFISAGAALIDCALGGGWPMGRVVNIVGDRSAGKTLLAIEAAANFHIKYPNGHIRYAESEAAFDELYAEALGMPIDVVEFNSKSGKEKTPLQTVEDWYKDMLRVMAAHKDQPILYILDSFDALSDDAEMERDIDNGATYGTAKAKKSGELFRKLVQRMEEQQVLLVVVSQLRSKIGVTFGETKTRSGGVALDYYSSHIVWLAEIGKIKRTIGGVERVVGADVRMRVKKNKVGLPFRQVDYPVVFGYGIDDLTAGVEWLLSIGSADILEKELGMTKAGYKQRLLALRNKGGDEMREVRRGLADLVRREWERVEVSFLPKSRKY